MHDMYCPGHSTGHSQGHTVVYACKMQINMFNVHNMQNVQYA